MVVTEHPRSATIAEAIRIMSWLFAFLVGAAVAAIAIVQIVNGRTVGGIAILVFGAPFAFEIAQTVVGAMAIPFAMRAGLFDSEADLSEWLAADNDEDVDDDQDDDT